MIRQAQPIELVTVRLPRMHDDYAAHLRNVCAVTSPAWSARELSAAIFVALTRLMAESADAYTVAYWTDWRSLVEQTVLCMPLEWRLATHDKLLEAGVIDVAAESIRERWAPARRQQAEGVRLVESVA